MGDKDMGDEGVSGEYAPRRIEEDTDALAPAKRQRSGQLRNGSQLHVGVQGAFAVPADEPKRGESLDIDRIARSVEQKIQVFEPAVQQGSVEGLRVDGNTEGSLEGAFEEGAHDG